MAEPDDHAPIVAADAEGVRRAAELLTAGRLVALPTETVYGLGARADDADAIARVFASKRRPADNPLIAHVAGRDHARSLVAAGAWDERADRLTERFWPGPLTLVLPRDPARVPDALTAGGPTVALRAPDHPAFQAVLAAATPSGALHPPFAIAAPSANPSERTSPTTAEHVAALLGDRVDLILDGGPCRLGLESSVVLLPADGPPRMLRPGSLPLAELRAAVPDLVVPAPGAATDSAPTTPAASPGQRTRHYAPNAKVVLSGGRALPEVVASALERHGETAVGVITRGPLEHDLPGPVRIFALPDEPSAYAARLYATFHEADLLGCKVLVVDAPPDDDAWLAVRDRLLRAAR